MTAPTTLEIYTIYKHPRDYPGKWVLRIHDVPGGHRKECVVTDTLAELYAHMPIGIFKMPLLPGDDPVIYEVWI